MATLKENINQAFHSKRYAYRQQNYQWLLAYRGTATHAVTLTFDPKKIFSFIKRNQMNFALNDDYLIECYQSEMRYFSTLLKRSLYGKSIERYGERLLLIPVLEGLESGNVPHYHCTIGVDSGRINAATDQIITCWTQTRFCGYHHDVKPFRDEGWFDYITKRCTTPEVDVIDWMNICVPTSPQLTLG